MILAQFQKTIKPQIFPIQMEYTFKLQPTLQISHHHLFPFISESVSGEVPRGTLILLFLIIISETFDILFLLNRTVTEFWYIHDVIGFMGQLTKRSLYVNDHDLYDLVKIKSLKIVKILQRFSKLKLAFGFSDHVTWFDLNDLCF